MQTFISKCPETKLTETERAGEDQYILYGYRIVRDFTHLLNMDTIISALDSLILHFAPRGMGLDEPLRRILPFLEHYLDLVKDQLIAHTQWTKALFKLDFVVCSVLHTLSTQGFCKPPDLDDSEDGKEAEEGVGSIGMGEGSGSQNISKDIEDESQVEGLQGEEEQDVTDDKGDNDAIEMNNDLGGDLEDVPDNGSQDGEDSDQGGEADPEEQLGNLDMTDPSVVDEKLWGDEKGPEDDRPQEKTNQDHSEQQSGESEVTAKEGNERPRSKEQPSGQKEGNDKKTPDVEDELISEVGDDTPNDPEISGAPMDDYVQDANTLDLPDDMDLDKDDQDRGDLPKEMESDGDEQSIDDAMTDGEPEPSPDDVVLDQQREAPLPDEVSDNEQNMEMPGQQETENKLETEATGEDAIARPDVSTGDDVASSDPSTSDSRESTSGGQVGHSEAAAGDKIPSDDQRKNEWVLHISHVLYVPVPHYFQGPQLIIQMMLNSRVLPSR